MQEVNDLNLFADNGKPLVLITGASGFIGSYLVAEALVRGYQVVAAVRDSSNVSGLSKEVRLLRLDFSSEEKMGEALKTLPHRPDLIIHNAGITKARRSVDFYEVNAELTLRFIKSLRWADREPRRFVYMSSLSSYGDPHSMHSITINNPQIPNTEYGKSKLRAESYVKESGLTYTIILPTGVYGPGDKDYLLSMQTIAKGLNFMSGLTPQRISFIYARDLAQAVFFLSDREEAVNESYMISDGRDYTDEEFGQIVKDLLKKKYVWNLRVPLFILKWVCFLGERYGKMTGRMPVLNRDKYRILAQRNWLCDSSPLFSLGFKPTTNLRDGVKDTLEAAGLIDPKMEGNRS